MGGHCDFDLIGWRMTPRLAMGSANLAEFFCRQRRYVDSRWRQLGSNGWPIIVGLMIGGALAAPFAAFMARKLPQRALMLLVATAVVLLSLRGLR
jgi:uncharacterized protein